MSAVILSVAALSTLLLDHPSGGELAGAVVRADPGREHRVPAPQRLEPERPRPRELTLLDHLLVATPHRVDEDVDRRDVLEDLREDGVDLLIASMVTPEPRDRALAPTLGWHRATGDKDRGATSSQFVGDAATDATCRTGDHGDLTL
jgi:hypothetical protein